MNNKKIPQSGITLIALIITIIVMLILVAVTVNIAVQSGLFGHAKNATQTWADKEREESSIGNDNQISNTVNRYAGGNSGNVTTPGGSGDGDDTSSENVATPGERVTENTEYQSDGKTAMIPAKFTVSGLASEQSIDGGLVIYLIPEGTTVDWTNPEEVETAQRTYDQFVWIPVADINDMYMCQSEDGTKSCNITVENGKAKCTTHNSELMAGRLYATGTGEKFDSTLTNQTYTANTGIREPDTVKDDNDAYISIINKILETSYTAENFKAELQREYNEIVKSVYENHGFYVGRYETSNITKTDGVVIKSVAGVIPSSSIDWYYMYAQQRDYSTNNGLSVGSTMIQGAAYDQVMKFVNTESFNVKTATNVGHNFSSAYQTGGKNYTGIYNDVSKNIFDLEGNVKVNTTEADNTYRRVFRGGGYNISFSDSFRDYDGPATGSGNIGSMFQLYVK